MPSPKVYVLGLFVEPDRPRGSDASANLTTTQKFYITICICRTTPIEELVKGIEASGRKIPKESTIADCRFMPHPQALNKLKSADLAERNSEEKSCGPRCGGNLSKIVSKVSPILHETGAALPIHTL